MRYLATAPKAGNFCKCLDITEHAIILISLRALAYFTYFITEKAYFLQLKYCLVYRQFLWMNPLYMKHVCPSRDKL